MSLAWARALPLGRIGLNAQASAWRPVFALRGGAQQAGTLARPLARRSVAPQMQMQMHTLPARTRYGSTRPGFAASSNAAASPKRGFRFSPWSRTGKSNGGKPVEEPLSVMARLRKLFREYGKAAVVVYFTLSVLDFPFFFMIVRIVGTETIAKIERFVVSNVMSLFPDSMRKAIREKWESFKSKGQTEEEAGEAVERVGWTVQEAEEAHHKEASLATQLALAYAVHKSFLFVRVPVTVAITPKVVQQLRKWGWNIGKSLKRNP